jgi:ATP-dependent helicase/nuclease subunit B
VEITLIGRPDRIDMLPNGTIEIFDYKTGQVPTPAQQDHFDKQLILLALMAENGGFEGLHAAGVATAAFVGLGAKFTTVPAKVGRADLDDHLIRLERLFRAYLDPEQGFAARRAMKQDKDTSRFDALARLGEWQLTDPAVTISVGDHDG